MPTVSDLIHSSFRLIGAIAAGETLETNELNDALVSLNQMIKSWETEGVSLFARLSIRLPLNSSTGTYSLANYPRPVRIESASVQIGAFGPDSPLQIVDSVGWEAVPEKLALSVYTRVLYCDYAWPTPTVYIAPLPRLGGTLEMWFYAPLQQIFNLGETIDLPPGYEQAIRYNFAVAILPEYPRSQVDPSLVAQAQAYKASIVQLNAQNHLRSQMNSPVQAVVSDAAGTTAPR